MSWTVDAGEGLRHALKQGLCRGDTVPSDEALADRMAQFADQDPLEDDGEEE